MRSLYLAAFAAAVLLPACDDMGGASGARGPCASSGEILACDEAVETAEDACWKLVDCGVIPVDHADENGPDWGRCMGRLDRFDEVARDVAIACVGAASCDALIVNDSPTNPYEWPDCLEIE
jgi:hypothetical protein